MKNTLLSFFVITTLLLGSCVITQEYHFNKDLSGNYKFEMKMGDLINMMQAMDTTGNFMSSMDTLDASFEEIKQNYKNAGAKNINVGWKDDKTTIFISFDFTDTDNLNSVLENSRSGLSSSMLSGISGDPGKFTHRGKRKISFDFPEFNKDTTSFKDIASMKDYISFETVFSFDRKIKSFNNENAKLSEDKNSITFSGKLDDIINKDYTLDTDIKLKIK